MRHYRFVAWKNGKIMVSSLYIINIFSRVKRDGSTISHTLLALNARCKRTILEVVTDIRRPSQSLDLKLVQNS